MPDGRHEPITQCPQAMIGPDIALLVRACRGESGGFLPVSGGLLDQTQSYLDASGQYLHDLENLRASH